MSNKISFDGLLDLVVHEAIQDMLDEIPPREELEEMFPLSENFENKMDSLFKKTNRNNSYKKFKKFTSRVAVVILLGISIMFSSVLSADAVWKSIVTTIMEWKEEFTSIFIESDQEASALPEIKFNYIPEGSISFTETFISSSHKIYNYKYENGDFLHIIVCSNPNLFKHNKDNEKTNYFVLEVDDNSGTWLCRDNENSLIISKDDVYFNISSCFSIEEIVQVYKNIEIL